MNETPIDYGDEASLVKSIDEKLTFKHNMYAKGSSCLSLQVEREGTDYVLKIHKKTTNIWDDRYFFYETLALKRAAEKRVPGVTRLYQEYDNGTYQAILKSFVIGTPGNKIDIDTLFGDPEFIRKLDKLYLSLHLAGISNISFLPRKIVFTNDNEMILVDLSTCLVYIEVGVLEFNRTMREDSQFISELERKLKKKQRRERRIAHA